MNPWDWLTAGLKGLVGMMREASNHGHKPSPENCELIRSYLNDLLSLIK